jgi:hypothetical protein
MKPEPDKCFETRKQFFGLNISKFCDGQIQDFLTRDPGKKNSDLGSGINIPDPQHRSQLVYLCLFIIQPSLKIKRTNTCRGLLCHSNEENLLGKN